MGNTWVTNIQHFLNEEGEIGDLPRPALNLANHFTSIIEEVTCSNNEYEPQTTKINCRRRPKRKKCAGNIVAYINKENPDQIIWYCPVCDDNGVITGWESTIYNNIRSREFN